MSSGMGRGGRKERRKEGRKEVGSKRKTQKRKQESYAKLKANSIECSRRRRRRNTKRKTLKTRRRRRREIKEEYVSFRSEPLRSVGEGGVDEGERG